MREADRAEEAQRIERVYGDRPPAPEARYLDAAHLFYVQGLERAVLNAIRQAGTPLAGAAVLEVGCGRGEILHRFDDFGAGRCAGVDLVEERIESARRRYPGLEFVSGDATALPYANDEFDLVCQFTCLSSVLDAAARAAIASEMWRVLRPGGLLLSYDMRRPTAALKAVENVLRLVVRPADDAHATPTRPLSAAEHELLFPEAPLAIRTTTLDGRLRGVARHSGALAAALGVVPALHSHVLVTAVKPARV